MSIGKWISYIWAVPFFVGTLSAQTTAPAQKTDLKYSFGTSPVPGFVHVRPGDQYTQERGYGFDMGSKVKSVASGPGSVTTENSKGFFFSAKLEPGAYRVTVTLGNSPAESVTTVKSETRRLMLEAVHTPPGQTQSKSFLVHVRVPQIPDGRVVRLKARENQPILYIQWDDDTRVPFLELDWDEKLTLEFSDRPALSSIEITNAPTHTRIYLVGDSTMTDQMMEPWAAWGQMLPRWFKEPVVIANYAESGESAASFFGELRWPKLMSEVRAGDYVLIQFGINDRGLGTDMIRQYFERFINEAREKGAIPVLVTSQNLERTQIGNYAQVMRDIAKEQNAPLIDLNAMSATLYQAFAPDVLHNSFFVDGTHHRNYGAYELAKCVVQASINARLPLAQHVVEDWKPFDPSAPDPLDVIKFPPDPQLDPARPNGPGAPDGRGGMAGDVRGGRRGGPGTLPATQPSGR